MKPSVPSHLVNLKSAGSKKGITRVRDTKKEKFVAVLFPSAVPYKNWDNAWPTVTPSRYLNP